MLIFPSGSMNGVQNCSNITIIDDTALEAVESFRVVLMTSDSSVQILNGQLVVEIMDNDGLWCFFYSIRVYGYLLFIFQKWRFCFLQ